MEALSQRFQSVEITQTNSCPIPDVDAEPVVSLSAAVGALAADPDMAIHDMRPHLQSALLFARDFLAANPLDALKDENMIGAIHLYTQQSPLCGTLNTRLRDAGQNDPQKQLVPFRPFLKLLLTALHALPPTTAGVVYCGVKENLVGLFTPGSPENVVWDYFSSATRVMSELESPHVLGTTGPRTIFVIEAVQLYDISRFSAGVAAGELLLAPPTHLAVLDVQDKGDGLLIVHMRQLPFQPLCIPIAPALAAPPGPDLAVVQREIENFKQYKYRQCACTPLAGLGGLT